jgi:hypothetical protein
MEIQIMKVMAKFAILTLIGSYTTIAFGSQTVAERGCSESAAVQPNTTIEGMEYGVPAQLPAAPAPQKATADPGHNWNFSVTPYLWFAGMHGTVGANGHEASVHADFGDIFSNLNIGLMAVAEARYKKFGAPLDFLWLKLSDDKALPFELGPSSVKAKIDQTMLAPKVSYRLVDGEMVKVDGNFGIRYFHLGTTLDFTGTGPQPSFYQSANWVDYIGGARIVAMPSPRILITVLGDGGAGGANLDYQVLGALGYKLKPSITLQAGWRYLDVNYRPSSTFVYDTVTNGLLLGATFNFK